MKTLLQKVVGRSIGTFLMIFLCTNLFGQLTPACSPSYPSGSYSWNISEITVGTFTKTIAYNTHDYTSDSFSVVAGETNSISLTSHGYCSVGIAGDFNNDGDFDDPGEVMVLAEYIANGTQTYTFDFAVPGSVLTGSYRFRAFNIYANSGQGTPEGSPCGTYGYGSWFDLTINVTNTATCQPPSNVQISDIAGTTATATWDASISTPSAYQWELFIAGDDPDTDTPAASGTVTSTTASITDLTSSTEYEFYVQSYCGASDLSLNSLPVSFFTLCNGTPTAGSPTSADSSVCAAIDFMLSIDAIATSGPGIEYQWQMSLAGQNDWTDIDGATGANYTTSQSEATDYRYYVTCTGSDMTDTSGVVSIEQNPGNECYCTPGNTSTSYGDIITNVTFAGIDNSSTGGDDDVEGYADYTQSVAPGVVLPMATYDFSAHTGNGGTEKVSFWIDYNANGVFEVDEYTYVGGGNNVTVTTQVTIPSNAVAGITRMRVRVKYSSEVGATNPCGGYTYGETEDYAIEILALEDCSGTPEPGMTILSTDSVCASGEAVNLSLEDGYNTYAGIHYQWQINTGDGWMDIVNDTNLTATVNVTETSWFRSVVGCGISGMEGTSDSSMVLALALPDVTVSPSSFAVCPGGSAVLTATGASEYEWAPEAGLTATTGASVQSSPTSSVTYTVTGTDDLGCVNTATVLVSPISEVQVAAAASADGFCDPGELVVISLDGVPEGISGGGNWSYQWMDADSNEVQGYSPISNYSTTPSEDGNYSYFVNLVASSCSDDTLTHAAEVNFTVGFGADGTPALINCNRPLGSISLSNGFGISSDSTYYSNDFSLPLDSVEGDSVALFNNANLQDGRLVLTNSQTSVTGAASIYTYPPSTFSGLDVYFDLTADTPINNYGTGGADGIAYSFGDDLQTTSTNHLQNGSGSKLRLSFDAADNGVNHKGIYLIYDYTSFGNVPYDDPAVYGFSANMDWKIQTDIPVHLHIDRFGKVTVTVNGAIIFNDVQLPDAYLNAEKSTWFSRFSAATGGDALRQAVDNLQINFKALQFGITTADNPDAPTEWQTNTTFEGLEVGTYTVWMSNEDQSCVKQVGTYEITDINPVVDLDSPINICEGESAILDAENPGSMYMWNTGDTTQTITVTEAGNYAVLVTDTASCTDLGSAAVNITAPSTVDAVTMTSLGDNQWLFTAVNPTATESYFWDFGDGETETTSIPTVIHTYATSGSYVVTVTVSSAFGCEDGSASGSFDIAVGISEIASEVGISLYPNPVSDILHIQNAGDTQIKSIDVLDATGKRVKQIIAANNDMINVDISALNNGMYIVMINTDKAVYHTRFVVAK